MDTSQLRRMRRHRYAFRFLGFVWALVGGIVSIGCTAAALDSSDTIVFNSLVISERGPKVAVAIFTSLFFLAGLGLLFSPAKFLDRLFAWRQSFIRVLMFQRG